jgi:hypothetical protein
MLQKLVVVTAAAAALSACYHRTSTRYAAHVMKAAEESVVNASFIVEPRSFKPFKVVVAPAMGSPRIQGTFSATGANNDIEVFVLDESQFTNWQSRHAFKAAYSSGRVTSDTLNVELSAEPGTYFVVFSNRFSIISNKGVVADVKLRYTHTT